MQLCTSEKHCVPDVFIRMRCTVSTKSALQEDPVYIHHLTDQERLLLWEQGTCPTSQVSHTAAHEELG